MRHGPSLAIICGMIAFVFGTAAVIVASEDPQGAIWLALIGGINLAVAYRSWRGSE